MSQKKDIEPEPILMQTQESFSGDSVEYLLASRGEKSCETGVPITEVAECKRALAVLGIVAGVRHHFIEGRLCFKHGGGLGSANGQNGAKSQLVCRADRRLPTCEIRYGGNAYCRGHTGYVGPFPWQTEDDCLAACEDTPGCSYSSFRSFPHPHCYQRFGNCSLVPAPAFWKMTTYQCENVVKTCASESVSCGSGYIANVGWTLCKTCASDGNECCIAQTKNQAENVEANSKVEKDFVKALKAAHRSVTNNDIEAYKLNPLGMSSCEIGVEIKGASECREALAALGILVGTAILEGEICYKHHTGYGRANGNHGARAWLICRAKTSVFQNMVPSTDMSEPVVLKEMFPKDPYTCGLKQIRILPTCHPSQQLEGIWLASCSNQDDPFAMPVHLLSSSKECPRVKHFLHPADHWTSMRTHSVLHKSQPDFYMNPRLYPNNCNEPAWNPLSFLRSIANKSETHELIVIGDSMQRDWSMQLMATLSPYIVTQEGIPSKYQVITLRIDGKAKHPCQQDLDSDLNLNEEIPDENLVRIIFYDEKTPYIARNWYHHLHRHKKAIFVYNLGPHFWPNGEFSGLVGNVTEWVNRVARDNLMLSPSREGGPHFIWRETAAQHFAAIQDFSNHGLTECMGWDERTSAEHTDYEAAQRRSISSVRDVLRSHNVPIIHTFEDSQKHHLSHRPNIKQGDCTHYWMPSGVYQGWSVRLLNVIDHL